MKELTIRQQQVLGAIRSLTSCNNYPPTIREVAAAVGLSSSSTVHSHIATLERLGLLRREDGRRRALLLTEAALAMPATWKPRRSHLAPGDHYLVISWPAGQAWDIEIGADRGIATARPAAIDAGR